MMFYALLLLLWLMLLAWLVQSALSNPGLSTITWGVWQFEMKTATLVAIVLLACLSFYFIVRFLHYIYDIRANAKALQHHLTQSRARRSLHQGLVQLTEGHFEKAEKILTENAELSETPLLNYLAAARAAHQQMAYERRDQLLQKAINADAKANLSVGLTQADMQLTGGQLEQAYATLHRLYDLSPKHPYVLKLLARVLYQQANWEELINLLPDLIKLNVLKEADLSHIQSAVLAAMFKKYVKAKDLTTLQELWRKLPSAIRENPDALVLYTQALTKLGDDIEAANLVSQALNKQWHEGLAEVYGQIRHHSLANAIQQAEKWAENQASNPTVQLLLARLYNQQKLTGEARKYYEASLSQVPNSKAYLEFAELLESVRENELAQRYYRAGLRQAVKES